MKKSFSILLLFLCIKATGQIAPNINLEHGDLSHWQFFTGSFCSPGGTLSVTAPSIPISCRHTLMSSTGAIGCSGSATDLYGGFPVIAPGGSYSLRLGNATSPIGGCGEAEKAVYYLHVPSGMYDYSVLLRYAIVLENPSHSIDFQPRFNCNVYDSASGMPVPMGYLDFIPGPSLPGFTTSSTLSPHGYPVIYRNWTTTVINLYGYAGHTIAVTFSTAKCAVDGSHFGYAYVEAHGEPLSVSSTVSCDTSWGYFTAPPNIEAYAWYDSATFLTLYGTSQSIWVPITTPPTNMAVIISSFPGFGNVDTLYAIAGRPDTVVSGLSSVCMGASILLSPATSGGTWSSSAPSIASVSTSGSVTGILVGSTNITYTLPGGCETITPIYVVPLPLAPPPITGTATVSIGTTTTLSNAATGGIWSSSAPTIATVSSTGSVFGIAAGTTVISYRISNSCGSAYAIRIVTVNASPTEVVEVSSVGSISFFPNPANADLSIMTENVTGDLTFTISDLTGRTLHEFEEHVIGARAVIRKDLRSLPAGIFLLTARNSNIFYTCRLEVRH